MKSLEGVRITGSTPHCRAGARNHPPPGVAPSPPLGIDRERPTPAPLHIFTAPTGLRPRPSRRIPSTPPPKMCSGPRTAHLHGPHRLRIPAFPHDPVHPAVEDVQQVDAAHPTDARGEHPSQRTPRSDGMSP